VGVFWAVNGVGLIIASVLLNILKYQSPTIKNVWGFKIIILFGIIFGGFMIFRGFFSVAKAVLDQEILKEAKERE
jgi:hypothetical protein